MKRWAAVLVLIAAGCRAQSATTPMWRHYERAGAVQVAILSGDLGNARSSATWIARHPAHGVPGEPPAYADSMRLAARAVAGTPDLADAAMATSRMAATCGSCHVATSRGPRYTAGTAPAAGGPDDVAQRMTLHQWALGKMWDGLTGPSDAAWNQGAAALTGAPWYSQHIMRRSVPAAIADSLAFRVQSLSLAAAAAAADARARVFGELLGTCAGCHERYRVRLPQPARIN